MCGIAGFTSFHHDYPNRQETITKICNAIAHRGPDEWGYELRPEITLGHRRLSIVGLNNGKQPMTSVCGQVIISFNGEIYNFSELKKQLELEGFKFRTETDTEVIINLYLRDGLDCFKHLIGMFAIAIWDSRNSELILARDRMGEKPLFYQYKNREIIFSSELKALIKAPHASKTLSTTGINKFLTYEYIPAPHTIFEDTYKVEAGEFIVFSGQELSKKFYWKHKSNEFQGKNFTDENEVEIGLEKILRSSIKQKLYADVPVGVLLSGGVDSSLITAIASEESAKKLNSFSIYFNEASYDESKYINLVVNKFGLEHHAQYVSSQDMLAIFDKLGSIMDEPMADPSIVPTYFLCKLAASKVKTVMGGDGADEIFAGYPTYQANKLVQLYNIIPYPLREAFSGILKNSIGNFIPLSSKNLSFDFKLRQFLRGAGVASEVRFFRWMAGFLENEKREVFSSEMQEKLIGEIPYDDLNKYLSRVNIHSELDRLLYLSQKMYLSNDILVKTDRASMANSLEIRAPYLDHRLIDFTALVPERYKLKGFKTKYILKKLARKYLPTEIVDRPKKGFGVPIDKWLREDLKEAMLDLLSESQISKYGILDFKGVKNLIDEHLELKANNRKFLWTLLCLQLWLEEFLGSK
jgi:asparagine synthase (glutamine-hydrolysing)